VINKTSICVLMALLVSACAREPQANVADLVILDAAIVTMNPAQPEARALAVRDGKIAYLGDDEHAQSWIGKDTRVLRLGGVTVLPGLIDTHIHLMESALTLDTCTFDDKQLTLTEAAPIILDCSARTPGESWVVVQRLNGAGFKADRQALDAILPGRPLLLLGADGHTAWANSAALKRAGVGRETVAPADGRIERDRDGEPTGFLVDGAIGLVSDLLEEPTPEQRERLLLRALHDLAAAGISTFMEANTNAASVETYVSLAGKNQLPARVTLALESNGSATDAEFSRLNELRKLAESHPPLRADMIKLFIDGVMEFPTQSAAMLEPYLDANGKPSKNLGQLYHPPVPLAEFVRRSDNEGFGVHAHAIGDAATRVALDAFAAARSQGSKRLYSISHLELVDRKDIPRFHELDVTACVQLRWAQPDNYSVDAVLPYIGPERQARLYPARAFVASGATIAGGSDWNVSTFNPFEAMAVAMSRTNPDEPERGVLGAGEALTLGEMFAAYTINAARMLNREAEVGSLEPGKAANIVVLDRRLTDSSSSADVFATKVAYTFNDGTQLFGPDSNP
jgi:predicted amidohydrolase YtcJ